MSNSHEFVQADGVSLHYRRFGADPNPSTPTVVMLHEGLGSIGQWRDLPSRIAEHSGLGVIAYERSGHGSSDPVPTVYSADFMDTEALHVLPEFLGQLGIKDTVLVGHSDGASIALVAAGSGRMHIQGVVSIAAHVFVEQVSINAITALDEHRTKLLTALARYHDHPELVFDRWRNIWLCDRFSHWNMTGLLADIDCPVLALQGDGDEYGTAAQLEAITVAVPDTTGHLLANCGHVAYRDQPEQVLDLVCGFLERLSRFT